MLLPEVGRADAPDPVSWTAKIWSQVSRRFTVHETRSVRISSRVSQRVSGSPCLLLCAVPLSLCANVPQLIGWLLVLILMGSGVNIYLRQTLQLMPDYQVRAAMLCVDTASP